MYQPFLCDLAWGGIPLETHQQHSLWKRKDTVNIHWGVSRRLIYSLCEAKLCHRLAEDGEGVSEARPGGAAEEIRPRRYVVDSKTETRRPKVGGWRRKCRSFVSARGVKPHTGVGGDFWSEGGGVYQSRQRFFLKNGKSRWNYNSCGYWDPFLSCYLELTLTSLRILSCL